MSLAKVIATALYEEKKGEVGARLETVSETCSSVALGKQGTEELEEALLKTQAAANTLREDTTEDVSRVEQLIALMQDALQIEASARTARSEADLLAKHEVSENDAEAAAKAAQELVASLRGAGLEEEAKKVEEWETLLALRDKKGAALEIASKEALSRRFGCFNANFTLFIAALTLF